MCCWTGQRRPGSSNLAKHPHTDLHERVDPTRRSLCVEVQLAATVRSTACNDQRSHCYLPAQLPGELRRTVSWARFVCRRGDTFRTAAHRRVINDAVGGRRIWRDGSCRSPATLGPGNSLPNRITLPLPEIEKWWLFPRNSPTNCPYNRSLRESPACSCSCRSLKQTMDTRLNMLVPYADDASRFTASGRDNRG